MASSSSRERIFLALAIAGTILPLLAFVPWILQHGLDVELFVAELFANRVAAFFGWDVIVSAITMLAVLALFPDKLTSTRRIGIALGSLLIGPSLGLPLYFYFQERERARESTKREDSGPR